MKPKHIAIILDGNRRYAKKKGLARVKGHDFGAKKVGQLIKWCKELGIKQLTLYAFSTENFKRPKKEVRYLMKLFRTEFSRLRDGKTLEKNKAKINIIGKPSLFPRGIQKLMAKIMEKTKNSKGLKLNVAMGYGSRQEIIDAINSILKKKLKKVNEALFSSYLWLKDEPDMLIRPGGERRLSNFLLWQSAYTELFFTRKLWPDFTRADLVKAIDDFEARERRFGR